MNSTAIMACYKDGFERMIRAKVQKLNWRTGQKEGFLSKGFLPYTAEKVFFEISFCVENQSFASGKIMCLHFVGKKLDGTD